MLKVVQQDGESDANRNDGGALLDEHSHRLVVRNGHHAFEKGKLAERPEGQPTPTPAETAA